MGIDMLEMQRLAGVTQTDDAFHSFRLAATEDRQGLDESVASGAKGWLSGVSKALDTWMQKLAKNGASESQLAALKLVDQTITNALAKLGETIDGLDTDTALFEDEVPAYTTGSDLDAFNSALAKLCAKLKKDMGATAVRQNYKGTGGQKFRRQLYVSFKDIPGPDLWLDSGFAKIGGVVFMPFADKSPITYEGKTPAEVYAEILKRMRYAQDRIKQAKADKSAQAAAAGMPTEHASVPVEALETVATYDIFGDHANWERALLNEDKAGDKLRKAMIMGLWKKYSSQLSGTGYARIDNKQHIVRMKPGGDVSGDLVTVMTKGTDVTLEDLSDAELKALFQKALPWLSRFQRAWVEKNADVVASVLPAGAE